MVSLLSLVAIAVFVSSLVVRVVRVCACARWVTLMVYFPAMALPAVVALNAVVLLVVLVAEKRSALDNAVLAVWKVVSSLFSVP